MVMLSVEEILEQAKQLNPRDLKRLAVLLEKHLASASRQKATRPKGRDAHTLELAGTGHSNFSDVSSNKGKHLYQSFLDSAARADAREGIRQGLEDVKRGRVHPARETLEAFRRRHGIPR
jgi:hypothetical protein